MIYSKIYQYIAFLLNFPKGFNSEKVNDRFSKKKTFYNILIKWIPFVHSSLPPVRAVRQMGNNETFSKSNIYVKSNYVIMI